ncbi:hypothetical protein ACERIT_13710 [Halopenitus sp. H-Gu1]
MIDQDIGDLSEEKVVGIDGDAGLVENIVGDMAGVSDPEIRLC